MIMETEKDLRRIARLIKLGASFTVSGNMVYVYDSEIKQFQRMVLGKGTLDILMRKYG